MKSILISRDNFLFVKLTPKLSVDFLNKLAYNTSLQLFDSVKNK